MLLGEHDAWNSWERVKFNKPHCIILPRSEARCYFAIRPMRVNGRCSVITTARTIRWFWQSQPLQFFPHIYAACLLVVERSGFVEHAREFIATLYIMVASGMSHIRRSPLSYYLLSSCFFFTFFSSYNSPLPPFFSSFLISMLSLSPPTISFSPSASFHLFSSFFLFFSLSLLFLYHYFLSVFSI